MLGILIKLLLPILIELIGNLENEPECPGGICEEAKAELQSLQSEMLKPRSAGFADFIKCLDFERLFKAVLELVAVFKAALVSCPPDSPVETLED